MPLFQIPAPDLNSVSVGVPKLQFLNALGFSDDGRLLLVQATFTDSFDPNGSDLRYAVWVYDVVAGKYTISLNALVAESAGTLRETDVLSARFAGGSSSQPNFIVHTALDDVDKSERLLMVSGQNTPVNIIATVLGADVRPSIQAYSVSTNGRFVALQTDSTFFSALDTNSTSDIYLLDLQSKAIERVSLLAGAETFKPISLGFVETNGATVSVSFTTEAGFSRADTNEPLSTAEARVDAYTWSREFGANGFVGTPTFTLLSQGLNGSASGLVLTDIGPVLTSAGSFFSSSSANLVANDTNSQPDIFVAAPNGGISRINLPSQSEWTSGAQLAGATDNGRILAVLTSSAEVAGPERNQQLVLLDQATKKYVVASSGAAGVGNDMVVTALISPKGDAAAFVSLATNLTGQPPATFGGSLFLVTGLADTLDNEATGSVSVSGTVAEGGTVTASVSATDIDGSITNTAYQWQVSSNGTTGWTDLSGATAASYAIASDQSQVGMYLRVVATTTDILGGTTTFTSAATTAVANFNDAPVVSNAIANQGSAEDAAWSYQVPAGTFSDADADTLSYTATLSTGVVLPNWLSFNAATRTFSGTPPQDFAGNVSLMVTASDGSASVTDTFVLTVSAVEDEAVGSASIGGTAAEGGTVTASVSATDIDGSITNTAYQWQVSSNGTTGWTDLSGATAASYAIASDQSQVGKYLRVVATTTDILGGTTTFTSAATTAITSVDFAPTLVTLTADQSTLDGTAWRLQIPSDAFIDKDGDALTYSASLSDGSSLPSWLSFNASNLTFFGTPPLNLSAVFNLKLTASDGRLSASDTFVLSVKAQRQNVTGTSGNDALSGISGSMSEIRGGAGNDTLTGGSRADVAVFSGNRADYTITTVAGVTTVRDNRTGSPDGTDTLRGMNILRFADIQLFQSSAANRVILAGQAQTYFVANSEVVQGTNAAEQFIVAPGTSALVFAGNNDVVDLSGSIGSYSFARAGTQLQINDGVYTTTLGVGGSFTLRTASGSTSVAIDFTIPGGAIRLGGTQIVGSTTFDPLLAITDRSNISQNAIQKDVIVTNGASYVARDDVADVFVIDASKSLAITISGFDEADRIIFTNRTSAEGALFDAGVIGDGISTITAGNASITLTNLTNDNFGNEATFESIYGANAIGYVI